MLNAVTASKRERQWVIQNGWLYNELTWHDSKSVSVIQCNAAEEVSIVRVKCDKDASGKDLQFVGYARILYIIRWKWKYKKCRERYYSFITFVFFLSAWCVVALTLKKASIEWSRNSLVPFTLIIPFCVI